ncbi:NADP-dependent oxidoreductase [Embleya hyalina]|uniref:NADP-dependent oxidoreductase n=1 Tax=Embleya hyalina TaxID=516124 RepID=A0A401YIW6_9ACTN|nr:NADP-dependent oxidoreductase [Embleya hyalina]GCD94543.1 NADP-dependent oxidoreductase [Embleya hyalina]
MTTPAAGNRQIRLAARPSGLPVPTDWESTVEPVPEPADGHLLVEVSHISLDPAMRGWMNDVRSYIPPVRIGEVMRAGAIGRVLASRHPDFAVGDHVFGPFGVQEYAESDGAGVRRVDLGIAPPETHLGVLGATGLTAYFGLFDIGRPQPGQTVLVSGAAGAVGSVVGQLARLTGCRAVGIAGGPDKCRTLTEEFGFDAAVDYKNDDVPAALRKHCPDGVDVFFDNVGGTILDVALTRLARGARVIVCGAISQYNNTEPGPGPSNYLSLLVNRASMTGMVVFDYADRYPEATAELAGWLADGRLRAREDVVEGDVTSFPETLLRLFTGANTGKLVLRIR